MDKVFNEICVFDERGVLIFYEDLISPQRESFTDRMNEEKSFENRM
jgi:hypothetical protein